MPKSAQLASQKAQDPWAHSQPTIWLRSYTQRITRPTPAHPSSVWTDPPPQAQISSKSPSSRGPKAKAQSLKREISYVRRYFLGRNGAYLGHWKWGQKCTGCIQFMSWSSLSWESQQKRIWASPGPWEKVAERVEGRGPSRVCVTVVASK